MYKQTKRLSKQIHEMFNTFAYVQYIWNIDYVDKKQKNKLRKKNTRFNTIFFLVLLFDCFWMCFVWILILMIRKLRISWINNSVNFSDFLRILFFIFEKKENKKFKNESFSINCTVIKRTLSFNVNFPFRLWFAMSKNLNKLHFRSKVNVSIN